MKKLFYLSAASLILFVPGIVNAQSSSDLTPSEVFCSNTSAKKGNAITEINKMIRSRSNRLSFEEKQVLVKMAAILDKNATVASICFPIEF